MQETRNIIYLNFAKISPQAGLCSTPRCYMVVSKISEIEPERKETNRLQKKDKGPVTVPC